MVYRVTEPINDLVGLHAAAHDLCEAALQIEALCVHELRNYTEQPVIKADLSEEDLQLAAHQTLLAVRLTAALAECLTATIARQLPDNRDLSRLRAHLKAATR